MTVTPDPCSELWSPPSINYDCPYVLVQLLKCLKVNSITKQAAYQFVSFLFCSFSFSQISSIHHPESVSRYLQINRAKVALTEKKVYLNESAAEIGLGQSPCVSEFRYDFALIFRVNGLVHAYKWWEDLKHRCSCWTFVIGLGLIAQVTDCAYDRHMMSVNWP